VVTGNSFYFYSSSSIVGNKNAKNKLTWVISNAGMLLWHRVQWHN